MFIALIVPQKCFAEWISIWLEFQNFYTEFVAGIDNNWVQKFNSYFIFSSYVTLALYSLLACGSFKVLPQSNLATT